MNAEWDKDMELLSEAFQVAREFDSRFNILKKDDAVLQMKEIDCGGDMGKILLDTEEVGRIVRNEE